jgi:hypothetical protein
MVMEKAINVGSKYTVVKELRLKMFRQHSMIGIQVTTKNEYYGIIVS